MMSQLDYLIALVSQHPAQAAGIVAAVAFYALWMNRNAGGVR